MTPTGRRRDGLRETRAALQVELRDPPSHLLRPHSRCSAETGSQASPLGGAELRPLPLWETAKGAGRPRLWPGTGCLLRVSRWAQIQAQPGAQLHRMRELGDRETEAESGGGRLPARDPESVLVSPDLDVSSPAQASGSGPGKRWAPRPCVCGTQPAPLSLVGHPAQAWVSQQPMEVC